MFRFKRRGGKGGGASPRARLCENSAFQSLSKAPTRTLGGGAFESYGLGLDVELCFRGLS